MMPMVYWDGPNSNILYANIEQVLYVSIPGVSPNSTMLTVANSAQNVLNSVYNNIDSIKSSFIKLT